MSSRTNTRRYSIIGTAARVVVALTFVAASVLAGTYLALPLLGLRGDLNALVAGIVRSAFSVPVSIGAVVTEPLSHLSITRLRTVALNAQGKVNFATDEISFHYDPLELIAGNLQKIEIRGPTMYLNLDADLNGVAQMPTLPAEDGVGRPPPPPGTRLLPFSSQETILHSGDVTLRVGGRELHLENLSVHVHNLGAAHDQRFSVRLAAFGAALKVDGRLDVTTGSDGARRYTFVDTTVSVERLALRRLIEWLASAEVVAAATSETEAARPAESETRSASRTAADAGPAADADNTDSESNSDSESELASVSVSASDSTLGIAASTLSARRRAAPLSGLSHQLLDLLQQASGSVQVEGALRGTWPDRVELTLTSRGHDLETRYADALTVSDGAANLTLECVALGGLDSVRFRLESGLSGQLESSALVTQQQARLSANGDVSRTSSAGAAGYRLNLEDFEAELISHVLGGGQNAQSEERRTEPSRTRGRLSQATFDTTQSRLAVATVDIASSPVPAAHILAHLPESLRPRHWGVEVGDTRVSVDFQARDVELDELGLAGKLMANLAFEPTDIRWARRETEARGVGLDVGVEIVSMRERSDLRVETVNSSDDPGHLQLRGQAALRFEEALVGDVYLPTSMRPWQLDVRSTYGTGGDSAAAIEIESARLEAAPFGTVFVTGHVIPAPATRDGGDAREPAVALEVRTGKLDVSRLFSTLVVEPHTLTYPWLAEAELDGRGAVDAEILGTFKALRATGRVRLEKSHAKVASLAATGLNVDLPFTIRPLAEQPPKSGFIKAKLFNVAGVRLNDVSVELRHRAGVYDVAQPVTLPLFGGRLNLSRLTLFGGPGRDVPTWRAELSAEDLDLEEMTQFAGWPTIRGTMNAVARPLHFRQGHLDWSGHLELRAFGGRIRFSDLTLDDVLQPYASLQLGEGSIENVRLREMGETFHFGIMSGILTGRAKNFQLTAGELSAFDLKLHTIPTPGVEQYVDRRAADSLRRTLSGPLGAVEEGLFSKFYYQDFGFSASLRDGALYLQGDHREGDTEYIMLGRWYQVPSISIINSKPGRPYDWEAIVANVRSIYERKQESSSKTRRSAPDAPTK